MNVKNFCFLAKFKANVETQQMTIRTRDATIESQKTESGGLQGRVVELKGKALLIF